MSTTATKTQAKEATTQQTLPHTEERSYTGEAPVWRVDDEKTFVPVQVDGKWQIRCRWSEKMGLQLNHTFTRQDTAQEVIDNVHAKGWITMAHWKKVFSVKDDFLTGGEASDLVEF